MRSKKSLFQLQRMLGVVVCGCSCAFVGAQSTEQSVSTYPPVQVVDKPLEYRQFEKVEITGSSIIRKEQTLTLPVQVITRDDIRRSGSSHIADVLHSLPIMSMVVNSAAMSTTIGGYTTASLRSLPAGTLLLLNGKRLATFGRQSVLDVERPSVDINTVPLAAIEKIEILSDGASSLYGSDAIAGVINIITRRELKGVEIMVEKSASAQGGGAGEQMTLNAGTGNLKKDGFSLRLTAELQHRAALDAADRPQYAQGRYIVERDGEKYAIDGARLTSFNTPGVFSIAANAATGQVRKIYSVLNQNGACPDRYIPVVGQASCLYNAYSGLTIYPQQDSRKILLAGEKWLSNGATAYAEILHSNLKDSDFANLRWPQLLLSLGTSPTSVGYQEAVNAGLDPSKTKFNWSPSLFEGLRSANEQSNWRVTSGVKGEWGGWDYDAHIYKSHAEVKRYLEVADFASLGWVTGKELTDPNMLKQLTADNPLTATINGLRNAWDLRDTGITQITTGNVRASRPLMEIDGKDAMLGVGLEWRRESTDYQYVSNVQLQPSFQARRDIQAGFLELQVPVTRQWDVTASTRRDRYSDFGSTQNSKIASRFDFENGWSARGSWGTGFRAPLLAQTHNLENMYLVGLTTYLNECSADMKAVAAKVVGTNGSPAKCVERANIVIYGSGNPNLKPELSEQKSLGLAYRPTRNFSITADWWAISMNEVISTLSDRAIYGNPLEYAAFYTTQPNGTLAIKRSNYNMGKREKSGIDFDIRWRAPTDFGQWNFWVQGTFNLKSKDQNAPGEAFISDLAKYNPITDSITPRLRTRWIAGLTTATWSLHGVINHTSGYADQNQMGVNMATGQSVLLSGFNVPAFTTLDVNAAYQLSPAVALRATIGNLLNRQAPQAFTATAGQVFGFNTRDHNLWGRTFGLALTAKF
jgi:iron complex outermembrane receptor protein